MEESEMETVGVRELKNNLSKYLKIVKTGQKVIVTERRKQVAVIMPLGLETEEDKILQLIQKGTATWSGAKPKGMMNRIKVRGKSVSEAIIEDRR
jgi:prevent-host-death family protein